MFSTRFFSRRPSLVFQIILTAFVLISSVAAAPGDLDSTFNPGLFRIRYDLSTTYQTSVNKVLIQPDGKLLAIGNFQAADKYSRSGIVRYNLDGSIDDTFRPPEFENNFFGSFGQVITGALQPDGKILIGFSWEIVVSGQTRRGLIRLNADGSFDSSFNIQRGAGQFMLGGYVGSVSLTADDKILLAGSFVYSFPPAEGRSNIARVFADGTPDSAFNAQPAVTGSVRQVVRISPYIF